MIPTGAIEARAIDVSRRYGDVLALDRVSLDVPAGQLVGLLGPNGAGKSTLVNLFTGLRRPSSGTVELRGGDPRDPARRTGLGVTPQETGLPPSLRVGEVVDFVRAHYPDPLGRSELLDRFGLSDLVKRQTGGLSGGQKRRVAVALDAHHAGQRRQRPAAGQADPADGDQAAYRRDGVVRQHPATPDHDHPPGQGLDLFQVVTGEHDRAALRVELTDAVPQRVPGLHVEPGGRLVEEDDARPADEGQGDRHPSLLPAGQAAGLPLDEVAEAEAVQQLVAAERLGEVRPDEVDDLTDP